MANDTTRQAATTTTTTTTNTTDKAFTADQWKQAEPTHAKAPDNANVYAAAAAQHTAGGGSADDVTLSDAAKTIKLEEFASLPRKPCVKDSLLTGMTAGFVVGSSRAIWRGIVLLYPFFSLSISFPSSLSTFQRIPANTLCSPPHLAPIQSACNWAVGTFSIAAISMYQYCQYKRRAEKEGMTRAMEIIDRKQIERKQKEARMERARELRRQKKEAEDESKFAQLNAGNFVPGESSSSSSSWWKFW
jgi:cytochrome c oxidase assembly protein subunit 20